MEEKTFHLSLTTAATWQEVEKSFLRRYFGSTPPTATAPPAPCDAPAVWYQKPSRPCAGHTGRIHNFSLGYSFGLLPDRAVETSSSRMNRSVSLRSVE